MIGEKGQRTLIHYADAELEQKGVELYALAKQVYKDLKEKNHYIISGFKYGCDFLAYKDDPNFIHSDYLICCFV